jgi:hypothetical protein
MSRDVTALRTPQGVGVEAIFIIAKAFVFLDQRGQQGHGRLLRRQSGLASKQSSFAEEGGSPTEEWDTTRRPEPPVSRRRPLCGTLSTNNNNLLVCLRPRSEKRQDAGERSPCRLRLSELGKNSPLPLTRSWSRTLFDNTKCAVHG